MKKKLIAYSGGIGSFWAAKLMVDKYGSQNVVAIFTDVNWEDEDLYKFIEESIVHLGIDLIYLQAPFNPIELMEKENCLYNSRMASCSRILKMRLQYSFILDRKYKVLYEVFDMEDLIIHGREYYKKINAEEYDMVLGIDWTEVHRTPEPIRNWKKYNFDVLFPLVEDLTYTKEIAFKYLEQNNIIKPRAYKMGFSHNNCASRCIKGGQGHFKLLYETFPERFKFLRDFEKNFNSNREDKHSFMTKQRSNIKYRYTLEELEDDITSNKQIDLFDIGGCGCFIDGSDIESVFSDTLT